MKFSHTELKPLFRDIYLWLRPYSLSLGIIFTITFLCTLLLIFGPLAVPFLIDRIILNPDLEAHDKTLKLLKYSGLFALCIIVGEVARSLSAYWIEVVNAHCVMRLRRQAFHTLIHLPLPEVQRLKIGGAMGRIVHDTEGLNGMLNLVVLTPGVAFLRVVLGVMALFVLNWRLAVLAALIVPPMLLASLLSTFRVAPLFKRYESLRHQTTVLVSEVFSNLRLVRSVGKEKSEERRHFAKIRQMMETYVLAKKRQVPMTLSWTMLPMVAGLVMIGVGGIFVVKGYASIGQVITFQLYSVLILEPVSIIVNFLGKAQSGIACVQRVSETLSWQRQKPDTLVEGKQAFPSKIQSLVFQHVGFTYETGNVVLDDLTFELPVGKTTVLVGKSGAGKSTIADLLVRFYHPTRGQILINGASIHAYALGEYRSQVAIVQQDTMLFDATVRENIAYAKPAATHEEIVRAAQNANAHDFIMALPAGYDTVIGEHGQSLSGGQRQRLSIARAYLCNPQILILDEASSHLDVESEEIIHHALKALLANRTTFVIGHKLSTIMSADMILFLEGGRILESGTHHELMALKGHYYGRMQRQNRLALPDAENGGV